MTDRGPLWWRIAWPSIKALSATLFVLDVLIIVQAVCRV